jgi:hypothetical protein
MTYLPASTLWPEFDVQLHYYNDDDDDDE